MLFSRLSLGPIRPTSTHHPIQFGCIHFGPNGQTLQLKARPHPFFYSFGIRPASFPTRIAYGLHPDGRRTDAHTPAPRPPRVRMAAVHLPPTTCIYDAHADGSACQPPGNGVGVLFNVEAVDRSVETSTSGDACLHEARHAQTLPPAATSPPSRRRRNGLALDPRS